MKLLESIDNFLNYLRIELQRSPCTIDSYRKDLKYFHNYISQVLKRDAFVKDITTYVIRKYLAYAKEVKGYSPRTMARNIATLKSFFNFLELEGLASNNAAKRLHCPKIPETLPRHLSREEVERIFNAVDLSCDKGLRDITILKTLYYSGIRVSELVSLHVHDIINYEYLLVRQGKGGRFRYIPIHLKLRQALEIYMQKRLSTSHYLFYSMKGNESISTQCVRLMVKEYAKKAGIDPARVTPHVFRHSFATYLYKNGKIDLLRISKLLGHANLRATTIYTHTSVDHLRDAIDKL